MLEALGHDWNSGTMIFVRSVPVDRRNIKISQVSYGDRTRISECQTYAS